MYIWYWKPLVFLVCLLSALFLSCAFAYEVSRVNVVIKNSLLDFEFFFSGYLVRAVRVDGSQYCLYATDFVANLVTVVGMEYSVCVTWFWCTLVSMVPLSPLAICTICILVSMVPLSPLAIYTICTLVSMVPLSPLAICTICTICTLVSMVPLSPLAICTICTLVSMVPLSPLVICTSKKAVLPLFSSSFVNFVYGNAWLMYEKKESNYFRSFQDCESIVHIACPECWSVL